MDLIQEIRRAREALRHQENKTSEAGFTLRMAKEQEKKARAELDQLLDELETGESRYTLPGFDRLEMVPPGTNGNGNGPATIPGPINWTERDLDGSLLAALRAKGAHGESGHWELLRQSGCTDQQILETLGATWPRRFRFDRDVSAGDRVGRTVRGGPKPAFWYGMLARIDDPPTLDGLALAARVRVVLDLPLAGQKQDAGLEQAPKGPNKSARGDAPSRR